MAAASPTLGVGLKYRCNRRCIRAIVIVPTGGGTRGQIVPTLTFVAAGYAKALQVSHFIGVIGRKLLRIDAKCAEKFRQFVGGVGPLLHKEL
jgi:hypothetical protein